MSDFREGQVENRAKTGNAQFSWALKGNFYNLSLNGKNVSDIKSDFAFESF